MPFGGLGLGNFVCFLHVGVDFSCLQANLNPDSSSKASTKKVLGATDTKGFRLRRGQVPQLCMGCDWLLAGVLRGLGN